jgi:hypothetical protein
LSYWFSRVYCAVMVSRLLSVTLDAHDPARPARFWAAMLRREVVADAGGALLPGEDTQLGLRFIPSRAEKVGRDRMHLHLTSTSDADQQHTVATALGLGASHLDVGQRPEEGHIVLADPEGNDFCVIEPGNAFLAGCGLLGELACDGTREVGLFWSEALGWPLEWDQDEETAIQSPRGGTKVAWGGPPVTPKKGEKPAALRPRPGRWRPAGRGRPAGLPRGHPARGRSGRRRAAGRSRRQRVLLVTVMESYVERAPLPGLAGVVRTVWIQRTGGVAYADRTEDRGHPGAYHPRGCALPTGVSAVVPKP